MVGLRLDNAKRVGSGLVRCSVEEKVSLGALRCQGGLGSAHQGLRIGFVRGTYSNKNPLGAGRGQVGFGKPPPRDCGLVSYEVRIRIKTP